MLQITYTLPISKGGSLTHPNSCALLQIFKSLLSCPLVRGESYLPKLHCMTTDVANHFFLTISKGGVLLSQTPVNDYRCCKPLLSCPLAKRESYPPKLQCMTTDVANHFSPYHKQGEESYPPKLQFTTSDVANHFSAAH